MSVARAITKSAHPGASSAIGAKSSTRGPGLAKASRGKVAAASRPSASAASEGSAVLRTPKPRGSYKTSSRTDQSRLAELKVKLGDPAYMDGAILRIATVLSARLTLR
jgi:hypothetical protein